MIDKTKEEVNKTTKDLYTLMNEVQGMASGERFHYDGEIRIASTRLQALQAIAQSESDLANFIQ
eukprot:8069013-Alexandrium_andersonii.AAC.1